MLQKHVVVFTGESCAGKSTLARMVADRNGMQLFAVGGFERDYAKSLGYNDIVAFEREFGLGKAYYSLIPAMLQRIESLVKQGIVIDGVYDPDLYERISAMSAGKPLLVSVTAPLELRILRGASKNNLQMDAAREHILQLDLNKETIGSKELAKNADLVVYNDSDIERAYSLLESELKRLLR